MIIRFQCVHDLSCVAGNGDALSSAAVLRTEEKPSRTCLRTIKGPNPIVPVSLQAGHRGHKWGGRVGALLPLFSTISSEPLRPPRIAVSSRREKPVT